MTIINVDHASNRTRERSASYLSSLLLSLPTFSTAMTLQAWYEERTNYLQVA
jgi:hypothetical protein